MVEISPISIKRKLYGVKGEIEGGEPLPAFPDYRIPNLSLKNWAYSQVP